MILGGLLVAGLYPFNFFHRNQVEWLPSEDGIRFKGYGQVCGPSPGRQIQEPLGSPEPEISIEFRVTSYRGAQPEVEDLLAVYSSNKEPPFAIGQSITDLVLTGWFRNSQGGVAFKRSYIDKVFAAGVRRFITVTSGPRGTTIYLEGIVQRRYPGLLLASRNFDGRLLLGQTARAHQKWYGDILGLAIYCKELTQDEVVANYGAWRHGDLEELRKRASAVALYPFDEGRGTVVQNRGVGGSMAIPERLCALHPVVLEAPSRRDLTDVSDITLNVLEFIPLGGCW
jgi:hypothetical protein